MVDVYKRELEEKVRLLQGLEEKRREEEQKRREEEQKRREAEKKTMILIALLKKKGLSDDEIQKEMDLLNTGEEK